jgi:hypothetical protein
MVTEQATLPAPKTPGQSRLTGKNIARIMKILPTTTATILYFNSSENNECH